MFADYLGGAFDTKLPEHERRRVESVNQRDENFVKVCFRGLHFFQVRVLFMLASDEKEDAKRVRLQKALKVLNSPMMILVVF